MNIIAQTCSVRSWIIIAIDFKEVSFSCRGFQQQRNDMCLGTVVLADRGRGTGSIEVTKRNYSPPVCGRVPMQYSLQHKLGFTVGVDRFFGMMFVDGSRTWVPIYRSRGRKHKPSYARCPNLLQKGNSGRDIRFEEDPRIRDGFRDQCLCRKMKYRIKASPVQYSCHLAPVADV